MHNRNPGAYCPGVPTLGGLMKITLYEHTGVIVEITCLDYDRDGRILIIEESDDVIVYVDIANCRRVVIEENV